MHLYSDSSNVEAIVSKKIAFWKQSPRNTKRLPARSDGPKNDGGTGTTSLKSGKRK
ncbi:MAG: hypothetical protein ACI8Q3_000941 [Marinomonas primoryensis]|jgi:hypothetical protein